MRKGQDDKILSILAEDEVRMERLRADYNPLTGEGAPGDRVKIVIPDFIFPEQNVPRPVTESRLVKQILKAGSVEEWCKKHKSEGFNTEDIGTELLRIRTKHDFLFWAYITINILSKKGGKIRFKLNHAQLLVFNECEDMRLAGVPIGLIIVKARQWGGSTFCIFYQTWLALKWDNYHSFAIAAHVQNASETILKMLKVAIKDYPAWDMRLEDDTAIELAPNGTSGKAFAIKDGSKRMVFPFEIFIGTAENPDSLRAPSIRGAHYSEVGIWPDTPEKRAIDIISSISSGIPVAPYSMQVMESTAKSADDFFHETYMQAVRGESFYRPIFIPWFEIIFDTLPIKEGKEKFAKWLYDHKDDDRPNGKWLDSGKHYWWLWTLGATLEGINWYRFKRKEFTTYSQMANEAPSTDIEAFQAAGSHVFDIYDVERFAKKCRAPLYTGELVSDAREGAEVLNGIRFMEKDNGPLLIYEMPDDTEVSDRYLVSVDVGGPNPTSDYSSVRVFDRLMMMGIYDGVPSVVAEMRYHTDHDLLAYDAMRLAKWYGNALLVIESNTLETKDKERDTGGGSEYILDIVGDIYPNLYYRRNSAEDIVENSPRKWGFHTNVSTKSKIIDHMKKCLRDDLWEEPSVTCCAEMASYIDDHGKMTAPVGKHDDVLLSTAIGLYICYREMELPRFIEKRPIKRTTTSGNNSALI